MAAPNPVAHGNGLITELSVDIAIGITSGERELSWDARVIGGDGGRGWPENIGLMAHMVRAGLGLPASLAQFQGKKQEARGRFPDGRWTWLTQGRERWKWSDTGLF